MAIDSSPSGSGSAFAGGHVPAAAARNAYEAAYSAAQLPAAVLQASEWRFLVRMLYTEAGSPPVPDYPRHLVQEILWGHAHAGAGFFEAMLTALTKPTTTARSAAQRILRRAMPDAFTYRPRAEIPAAFEFEFGQTTAASAVVVSDDGTLRVHSGSIEDELRPAYRLVPGARTPSLAQSRAKHGFNPPNPNGIATVPEFVEALKLLQRWSGLNLREIQEQSRKLTKDDTDGQAVWLARSTVSDMLRRTKKLPKPETLRAFTAACGVTPAEQERWLNARNRLARGGDGENQSKRPGSGGGSGPGSGSVGGSGSRAGSGAGSEIGSRGDASDSEAAATPEG